MPNNLVLGRGKLFFDRFTDGTEIGTGERYLGSTTAFGLTVETEEREHYSSEEGLRVKDLSVTVQVNYTAQYTTETIDPENTAQFFLGTSAILTQGALAAQVDSLNVNKGRFYQLGKTALLITGKRNVTVTSVTSNPAGTTYVAGTDYVVQAALGRMEIPLTSAIANGAPVLVTYSVAASSRHQVISGSDLIYGALRFISFNGVGDQADYYMPKVALRPNGEFALKGEDFQAIGFSVEVLKLGAHPNILQDGRPFTP